MDFMQQASNVLEQLITDTREKFAPNTHQQGVFDSLRAFAAAVDWKVKQLHIFRMLIPVRAELQ